MSKRKIESQATFKSEEGWKFFVNDSQVTEEQYVAIMEDHMAWAKEQEAIALAEQEPEPVKKKRNKK